MLFNILNWLPNILNWLHIILNWLHIILNCLLNILNCLHIILNCLLNILNCLHIILNWLLNILNCLLNILNCSGKGIDTNPIKFQILFSEKLYMSEAFKYILKNIDLQIHTFWIYILYLINIVTFTYQL